MKMKSTDIEELLIEYLENLDYYDKKLVKINYGIKFRGENREIKTASSGKTLKNGDFRPLLQDEIITTTNYHRRSPHRRSRHHALLPQSSRQRHQSEGQPR